VLAPVIVVVLAFGIPFNYGQFEDGAFNSQYLSYERQLVLAIAASPNATQVPSDQRVIPDYFDADGVTYGWLLGLKQQGKVAAPGVVSDRVRGVVPLRIGVAQLQTPPPTANCQHLGPIDVNPKPGDTYGILTTVNVTALQDGQPASLPVKFDTANGSTLVIRLPNLHLRVTPAPPDKVMTICQ
jgi:hypothetical protein